MTGRLSATNVCAASADAAVIRKHYLLWNSINATMSTADRGKEAHVGRASTVIAIYAADRADGLTTTVFIHLLAYCAVTACVAFSLYALLVPSRVSSSEAEYKLVPAMVVRTAEPLPTEDVALPIAPVVPNMHGVAAAPISPMELEAETMGRPNPQPEMKPWVTAPSPPQTNNRPNRAVKPQRVVKPQREVRMESAKRRSAQCIPAYDSSGAQTKAC